MTLARRAELAPYGAEALPPALAYLARMPSAVGRETTLWKLDLAAGLLSGGAADATTFPWQIMTPATFAGLKTMLLAERANGRGPYAGRTVNTIMANVRGVLRECWRSDLIDADRLARIFDGVRPERVNGDDAGRHLAPGEIMALFRAAAVDPYPIRGARDAALLALLYGGGLRRAEALAVKVGNVNLDAGSVFVASGKGRKARTVPLLLGAADALGDWIRAADLAGDPDGPLLRAVRPFTPEKIGGPMAGHSIVRQLARLAEAAAVPPFTAHDFRRTFVGDLLSAGVDMTVLARMMGHASITMTASYDRRGAEAAREAARRVAVPYLTKRVA